MRPRQATGWYCCFEKTRSGTWRSPYMGAKVTFNDWWLGRRKWVTPPDRPRLCRWGVHACYTVHRALHHIRWYGNEDHKRDKIILCKVRLLGEVERGRDKMCAKRRVVLEYADVTRVVHRYGATPLAAQRIKELWNTDQLPVWVPSER